MNKAGQTFRQKRQCDSLALVHFLRKETRDSSSLGCHTKELRLGSEDNGTLTSVEQQSRWRSQSSTPEQLLSDQSGRGSTVKSPRLRLCAREGRDGQNLTGITGNSGVEVVHFEKQNMEAIIYMV
jgi:hypothetical protein